MSTHVGNTRSGTIRKKIIRAGIIGLVVVGVSAGLGGCGGGGGGGAPSILGTSGGGWVAGVYPASSTLINQCAAPRSGTDLITGVPYPDRAGSTLKENLWLRSWTNELYLWYNEIVDQNPGSDSTDTYFQLLKTQAVTPSGKDKDQFHFTESTSDYESQFQAGVEASYGAEITVLAPLPPRSAVVAFTQSGSPAANANLQRGAQILTVDGADVVNGASVDVINAGLFPQSVGENHTFVIQDLGAATTRTIMLTSASVALTPVQNVKSITTGSGNVGYMLFNEHIATSEDALIAAVNQLNTLGVNDLILDIRYNGGGYLDIASELAYMIAGPAPTTGQTFDRIQFNAKHPTIDPVTGNAITPTPFHTTSQGFDNGPAQSLPNLNLARVYVLTGNDTCSASEAIINGLRGVGVQVFQIGSTTCGKPYGFYPQDNCGTTYFSIEFEGVNALGFGAYADGFAPANTAALDGAVSLPGCSVADDFTHALGDPLEGRLAAALNYRAMGTCPAATGFAPNRSSIKSLSAKRQASEVVSKPPLLTNRWNRR